MTKNPFVSAVLVAGYIGALVLGINYGGKYFESQQEPTLLIPMGMLALFVLSASVMGYLFLAKPLELYLDNKKKEAVSLFLKTVGIFAVITAIVLATAFIVK